MSPSSPPLSASQLPRAAPPFFLSVCHHPSGIQRRLRRQCVVAGDSIISTKLRATQQPRRATHHAVVSLTVWVSE